MKSNQKMPAGAQQDYVPNASERRILKKAARRREMEAMPRLKIVTREGMDHVEPDHPDPRVGLQLLMEEIGTADRDFLLGLIEQLLNHGVLTSGERECQLNCHAKPPALPERIEAVPQLLD
jgi:hypothetical protein